MKQLILWILTENISLLNLVHLMICKKVQGTVTHPVSISGPAGLGDDESNGIAPERLMADNRVAVPEAGDSDDDHDETEGGCKHPSPEAGEVGEASHAKGGHLDERVTCVPLTRRFVVGRTMFASCRRAAMTMNRNSASAFSLATGGVKRGRSLLYPSKCPRTTEEDKTF